MRDTPPTYEAVRTALACIPPEVGHDVRVRLAFAVFDGLGDAGADLWHAWADRRANPSPAEDRATWKSARKRGAVTVGTLFGVAKDFGFTFDAVQTPARKPSPAELKAAAEARRAAQEREAGEKIERQRAAAAEALRLWDAAAESGSSPYLQRKGVQGHGVRFGADAALLVPMRDAAGELWNLQTIRPERPASGGPEKLFLKDGRKTGTFHLIGNTEGAAWLLVAEGLATAASCFEATGRPVVVAFDAGNLAHVVRAMRGRCPAARLLVCGDDDAATMARTGKNPGRDKATEAARLVRGEAVFPAFPAAAGGSRTDFNDLHQFAGLEAVRDAIEGAITAADAARAAEPADKARRTGSATRAGQTAPAGRQRAGRGDGEAGGGGGGGGGGDVDAAGRDRWDRFRVDDVGLWFDPPADDGEPGRPVRVCGPLHVEAWARDGQDNGAALLLQFDTPFRTGRRWLMPLQTLAGDGAAYRAELLAMGFMVPTDSKRRALLTAYLQSRQPAELVRIVDRVGWHGRAYVLPRETLGDDGGERILFQSEAPTDGTFERRGSLDAWKDRIGRLCVGNSRLTFAASCAFAGPLLAWAAGTDGGGFHLVGDSSCGKTTALRVAASVWGGRDYLQRWRATDNGLEGMAAQHSDGLLCLDELAQLDAKVAGESAYMLANGQGKSRAGRTGAARPRLTWRLLFLSAGEIGLAEHMTEAGKRTRAGQELRMIDLPADAGSGCGIFEDTHGHEGGGALAQHLARACETTYGAAGRAWLEYLTDHTDGLARALRERMDAIELQVVPESAAGQVQRVGRRFALVAVAGELATEAGITGWPAGASIEAARRCFNAWIEARPGGIGLTEDAQIMRQVRQWFGLHGEARFTDWSRADDDHAPKTMNRAGWRKAVKTTTGLDELIGWEWFVLPDVFRAEACKGYRERAALAVLADRGHLVREGKHFGCRASPPGAEKVTVYRVRSSILGDADL
jgi:putative DNA primase/helicase